MLSLNQLQNVSINDMSNGGLNNGNNITIKPINQKVNQQSINEMSENKNFGFLQMMLRIRMKKFAKKIIYQTTSKMFKLLKLYHFSILNDYLSEFNEEKVQSIKFSMIQQLDEAPSKEVNLFSRLATRLLNSCCIATILQTLLKTSQCIIIAIPIIQPSSSYKLIWDISKLFDTLALLYYIPLHISFGRYLILGWLVDYLLVKWILDLVIQLNTGFYDKGVCITARWTIIKYYLHNNLYGQFLTVITLVYLYLNKHLEDNLLVDEFLSPNQLFLVFVFFKLNHFSQISNKIEQRFLLSQKLRNVIQLIKLFFTIVIIAHLFASVWILVANYEQHYFSEDTSTWIRSKSVESSNWLVQYIYAFYYTIVTMVTVGYGDISPQNPYEMIFSIVIIIFGCGVFAYSLNLVGSIFQEMFKFENEIKQNMYIINQYMNKKQVNQDLQFQVRKYLEYFWKENSVQNQVEEDRIIGQLTSTLQDQLLFEANKMILKDSPIFSNNFSGELLHRTVPLIKEYRSIPEEVLYLDGELDEQCIYFIEKGDVQLYYEMNSGGKGDIKEGRCIVKDLGKGQSFGQFSFFTGKARNQCARSMDFCTLLVINRQDFLDLLQSFPQDYERFCHIKDDVSLNNDYTMIKLKCFSCNSTKHSIDFCPLLHFVANKLRILTIHCRNVYQDGNNYFKRKRITKLNSLINLGFNQVMLKNFQKDEVELFENYLENLHDKIHQQKLQVDAKTIFFTHTIDFRQNSNISSSRDSDDDYYDDDQVIQKQQISETIKKENAENQKEEDQKGDIFGEDQEHSTHQPQHQQKIMFKQQASMMQFSKQDSTLPLSCNSMKSNPSSAVLINNTDKKEQSDISEKRKQKQSIISLKEVDQNCINSGGVDSPSDEDKECNEDDEKEVEIESENAEEILTGQKLNQKKGKKVINKKDLSNPIKQSIQINKTMKTPSSPCDRQSIMINEKQQLNFQSVDQDLKPASNTIIDQKCIVSSLQKLNRKARETIFYQKKNDNNIVENKFQNQLKNFQLQQQEQIQQISDFEFQQQFEKVMNFLVYKPWNNISFIQKFSKLSKQQILHEREILVHQAEQKLGLYNSQNKQIKEFNLQEAPEAVEEQEQKQEQQTHKIAVRTNVMIQQSKRTILKKESLKLSLEAQQLQKENNKLSIFSTLIQKSQQKFNDKISINNSNSLIQVDESIVKDDSFNNQMIPVTRNGKFINNNNNKIRFQTPKSPLEEIRTNDKNDMQQCDYKLDDLENNEAIIPEIKYLTAKLNSSGQNSKLSQN